MVWKIVLDVRLGILQRGREQSVFILTLTTPNIEGELVKGEINRFNKAFKSYLIERV